MGSSNWSDDLYTSRVTSNASTNTPTFAYDADIKAGKTAAKVHDKLSPFKVRRESRDSTAHPESVAIGVVFDVTGSMQSVPRQLQAELPKLLGLLLRKGYVKDPQILFGAIGDYHSDRVPLQVGQFESGVEMDDDVTRIYLEGNGGGSNSESYQNAFYFFANKTDIDCWEKRGKKGYLFLFGDEHLYPTSTRQEIATIFGDTVQDDVQAKDMIAAVKERYEVFFIIPAGTSHFGEPALRKHWEEMLGNPEHVLFLEDPAAVCETIGSVIGLLEGTTTGDTLKSDLVDVGIKDSVATVVSSVLDPLAKKTALAKVGMGNLPSRSGGAAAVGRL